MLVVEFSTIGTTRCIDDEGDKTLYKYRQKTDTGILDVKKTVGNMFTVQIWGMNWEK